MVSLRIGLTNTFTFQIGRQIDGQIDRQKIDFVKFIKENDAQLEEVSIEALPTTDSTPLNTVQGYLFDLIDRKFRERKAVEEWAAVSYMEEARYIQPSKMKS